MKKFLLLCGFIFIYSAGFAQQNAKKESVDKLMSLMHIEKQINESADRMLKLQAKSMPQLAQYKDVMSDFFKKYINWENIGEKVEKVYMQTFSESEVQDLISFYKSKTGQKLAEATPDLTEKLASISQNVVLAHQSELQQKIMDAMHDQKNRDQ